MITSTNSSEIRAQVKAWQNKGETVAFVATMGNLHQGHINLVKEAINRADHVVVSIFVNPLQFAEGEDFDIYPRTLSADKLALVSAGCDLLFTPATETVYPNNVSAQTFVEVSGISHQLCGQSRPHHFRGVATIVCKLLNLIQPDMALFGKKDFQQLLIIRTMVEDLSIPVSVIGIDTVRESSGLAMSSRNSYLTIDEKVIAPRLKQTLDGLVHNLKSGAQLMSALESAKTELINAGMELDYLEVRNANTLEPITPDDAELVVLTAVYLGKTRLIDNQEFSGPIL